MPSNWWHSFIIWCLSTIWSKFLQTWRKVPPIKNSMSCHFIETWKPVEMPCRNYGRLMICHFLRRIKCARNCHLLGPHSASDSSQESEPSELILSPDKPRTSDQFEVSSPWFPLATPPRHLHWMAPRLLHWSVHRGSNTPISKPRPKSQTNSPIKLPLLTPMTMLSRQMMWNRRWLPQTLLQHGSHLLMRVPSMMRSAAPLERKILHQAAAPAPMSLNIRAKQVLLQHLPNSLMTMHLAAPLERMTLQWAAAPAPMSLCLATPLEWWHSNEQRPQRQCQCARPRHWNGWFSNEQQPQHQCQCTQPCHWRWWNSNEQRHQCQQSQMVGSRLVITQNIT